MEFLCTLYTQVQFITQNHSFEFEQHEKQSHIVNDLLEKGWFSFGKNKFILLQDTPKMVWDILYFIFIMLIVFKNV